MERPDVQHVLPAQLTAIRLRCLNCHAVAEIPLNVDELKGDSHNSRFCAFCTETYDGSGPQGPANPTYRLALAIQQCRESKIDVMLVVSEPPPESRKTIDVSDKIKTQ